jgi:hypothetical protein
MNNTTSQNIPNNSHVIFCVIIGTLETGRVDGFEKFSLNSYYRIDRGNGMYTYIREQTIIAYTR